MQTLLPNISHVNALENGKFLPKKFYDFKSFKNFEKLKFKVRKV